MTKPIRVLIAPCGCMAAADGTDEFPGFCRTTDEAAEDLRSGFREMQVSRDDYRDMKMSCTHQPEWGVA